MPRKKPMPFIVLIEPHSKDEPKQVKDFLAKYKLEWYTNYLIDHVHCIVMNLRGAWSNYILEKVEEGFPFKTEKGIIFTRHTDNKKFKLYYTKDRKTFKIREVKNA